MHEICQQKSISQKHVIFLRIERFGDFLVFWWFFHVLPQSSGAGLFFFRIRQFLARIRSGAFFGLRINLQSLFWAPDQPPDQFFRMTEVGRFNLELPGLAAKSARSCKIHHSWLCTVPECNYYRQFAPEVHKLTRRFLTRLIPPALLNSV